MNTLMEDLVGDFDKEYGESWVKAHKVLFTRLIVEECIEIFKATIYHEAYPDNMLGSYDGLELLAAKIECVKIHFGMK